MTTEQVIAAAQVIPYGTATQFAASQICLLRGLDPNAYVRDCPVPLLHWQAVIAEEMLRAALLRTMAI